MATGRPNGRPPFVATKAQREEITVAAACGMSHEDMAGSLGISRGTLEKVFAFELSTGAYNRRVGWYNALSKQALKGNVAAAKALLAMKPVFSVPPLPEPAEEKPTKPPKVGLKEQRLIDARTASVGTEWQDLLPRGQLQ